MNRKAVIGIIIAAAALAAGGFFAVKKLAPQNTGLNGIPGVTGNAGASTGRGASAPGAQAGGGAAAPGAQAGGGTAAPGTQAGRGTAGPGAQAGAGYAMVRASVPSKGNISVTSSLVGTVAAGDVVYVTAKAAGDITAVYIKAGDYVEQGQQICEINTGQVESAKTQMDQAEIQLNNARSTLNRMSILYSGGDITDQEYEQYNNNVKSAELQFQSASLNYNRQVEYSVVTAPIAGRVESCSVEMYGRVNNNAELCVIAGESNNRIDFYVSERMMKNLRKGDRLEVIKNGSSYSGRITEISTMVDASTGLFRCKAELEETDEIAIGSAVKLKVVTDRAVNAMTVPVDAIYYSGSKGYVYVVEDGIARMRRVEVGLYDSENAQILDGLAEDDLVVGTWSSNLYDGANVRLLNADKPQ